MVDLDSEKYRQIFWEDAQNQFNILQVQIPLFEEDPGNIKSIENIYRAFHSFKGMAALMKYEEIFTLARDAADAMNLLWKSLEEGSEPGTAIVRAIRRLGLSPGKEGRDGVSILVEYLRKSLAELEKLTAKNCPVAPG